ncbi:MAG TPA: radical SAM protein [Rhodothermales bacterium]
MGPILCNYYVTYRCNATCSFCDIWEQPSPLVDPATVERNLADLRRLGVRVVDFTGGEPLLHPELHALLAAARRQRMITTVTTNALLYPKRARELAGKIDVLHFSIDSSIPEEHDASRGVACFGKLMESIEVALSLGESPDLLFTVTDQNVHRLAEVYDRISYPNRLVLIVNPLFAYHGVGGGLSEETLQYIEDFSHRPYTYLNRAFLTLRRRGGNDASAPVCRAVSTSVVISPFDELVLPCYHLGLEHIPIEGRLYELWQSDTVAEQRRLQGRHAACEGCSVNCYFEPSFATSWTKRYFWESLTPKLSYAWTKFVVQRARARLGPRAAMLPAFDAQPPSPPAPSGDGASEMLSLPVIDRSRA